MRTALDVTPLKVRLFTPATPTTFVGIAIYHDDCGEDHIRIARILAHSRHAAIGRLEEEVLAEYGVTRAQMLQHFENDAYADEFPVTIRDVGIFTDSDLTELDVLTTVAARGARTKGSHYGR